MVSNVKVIVGEECTTQHRLVVGDFKVCTHAHPKRRFVPRTKVWKLRDFGNQVEFSKFYIRTYIHLVSNQMRHSIVVFNKTIRIKIKIHNSSYTQKHTIPPLNQI